VVQAARWHAGLASAFFGKVSTYYAAWRPSGSLIGSSKRRDQLASVDGANPYTSVGAGTSILPVRFELLAGNNSAYLARDGRYR
jgi:hypothetical protein